MKKLITCSLLVVLAGCTEKTIVYKPSAELDPLPPTAEPGPEEAAGADPLLERQWSLERIGAADIEDAGNANLVIAVLSTGVDYTHPDLAGRVHINQREITPQGPNSPLWTNSTDDDDNGLVDDIVGYDVVSSDGFAFDRHGAGTALAGVIAARQDNGRGVSGILADCRIYPVRYINDNGQTSVYHLLRALDVAAAIRPHVILLHIGQLNLGGRFGDGEVRDVELAALRGKLAQLHTLQIPIIVGAGQNNAVFGTRPFDAVLSSFDNIAVVTSSDADDQLQFLANHSGQYVTTTAPGTDIVSTGLSNGYRTSSSTTLAAAHVAAAIGAVIARHGPRQDLVQRLSDPAASDEVASLALASIGRNRLNIARYLASFEPDR